MKLNSIVLGIIILIAFCYLYSRGFKEGQQNPSNVFVKAKVGAKVSGAGMAAYNGDYAIGIGGGEIATRCKKGKREKFCDLTKFHHCLPLLKLCFFYSKKIFFSI